jgi:hypothetical protein
MIIRSADCPLQPWKNGMGRTREIAVHPAGAGGADFLWRVSIAEVDSAAPFSQFPGIDRSIVLLDGAGFSMMLDNTRTHALTTPFAPFAFPGEASVAVDLADGSTRDFNLMVRRARARGGIEVWRERGTRHFDDRVALVYCARGRVDTSGGPLREGDAWRPDAAAHHQAPFELHDDTVVLTVRIEAA